MPNVLVVDDELILRKTLSRMLDHGGYGSDVAEDVEQALVKLAEADFDVIMADINLPGQSGIDLLRLIQQSHPDIAVVLITGAPSMATAREAVTAGAFDYLQKPVEVEEFLKVVAAAARQASLRKENRRLDRENEEYRQHLEEKVEAQVKEIAEKERRLQQALKLEAIGTLAAGIAHEINTPVQFIVGITTFLFRSLASMVQLIHTYRKLMAECGAGRDGARMLAEADAASQKIDLEFIENEMDNATQMAGEGIEQIKKIVSAMREFSHMGGGEKQKADLNRAIESTVTISRNEWKHIAEMDIDLDPKLPLVPCYPREIKQVLLNLIVNAAHAIADELGEVPMQKGRITVRSRTEDGSAVLSVSDTGTGIPEQVREKIFDPFFTTKEVGKGTGQGLSMAYATVVQQHGGTLTFETEMKKGTTFFIRLPLAAAGGADAGSDPQPGGAAGSV
ncbi:MAG: response regulator [Kiritimatiellae bacterium]|nr:response regulator [Kiritimatiellia bacterium]